MCSGCFNPTAVSNNKAGAGRRAKRSGQEYAHDTGLDLTRNRFGGDGRRRSGEEKHCDQNGDGQAGSLKASSIRWGVASNADRGLSGPFQTAHLLRDRPVLCVQYSVRFEGEEREGKRDGVMYILAAALHHDIADVGAAGDVRRIER